MYKVKSSNCINLFDLRFTKGREIGRGWDRVRDRQVEAEREDRQNEQTAKPTSDCQTKSLKHDDLYLYCVLCRPKYTTNIYSKLCISFY